jgi:urea transport system permease protein
MIESKPMFLRPLRYAAVFLILLLMCLIPAAADEAAVRTALDKLSADAGYPAIETMIGELAVSGEPRAALSLNALSEGKLVVRKDDGGIFILDASGAKLLDPVTGDEAGEAAGAALEKVKIKNSIRRKIAAAMSGLTLMAKDRAVRLRAIDTIFTTADVGQMEGLNAALAAEADPLVKRRMEEAKAVLILASSTDEAARIASVKTIAARGDRAALSVLMNFRSKLEGGAKSALDSAISVAEQNLRFWNIGQNVWYGLSLGSVLLLAAIGLAITFGVMGVINMAHGEMVMLGAYTTFVTQNFIRQSAPGLVEWSLLIALPLAFLFTALVGIIIERGIIKHLYGRPLETLLATWGVSLILQQAVRTIFGPTNQEVSNPSWMSGAFQIGQLAITWNRLWIIVFSLTVFAVLLFAFNRTPMGLQMRAVTQNRRMASAMGIRTPFVDSMTFGLGSGIAGIAGVALSQIDNVSPNLGQSYIIDSFMVVVFGGVGNLWGTFVGAMSLGIVNKMLEPFAGAVLGKILVLVLIILFIQKRPRGLFALKGRSVEA